MATSVDMLGPLHRIDLPEGPLEYHERGTGPVIVFVHGIIANADVWRHVVAGLADDHRCITPDWPLGAHRLPLGEDADFSLFGVAALVDSFLTALDLDQVLLVGNDTGGAVVQCVAARHPQRLAGVVLTPCDAFDNFLPPPIRHLQLLGRTSPGLWLLSQTLRYRRLQRLPIAFGRLTERPIPAAIMNSYTEPLRTIPGVRRDFAAFVRGISARFTREAALGLEGFDRPVLLAWARERRRFFPVDHAYQLAGHLPNATVALIDDSGPFVTEDRPEAVVTLIRQFVRQAGAAVDSAKK